MKKNVWFFILLLCFSFSINAQQDTIAYRIVLLGDGGELANGHHTVTEAVKKTIPINEKTTILLLGDNIYKRGLPLKTDLNYNHYKEIIDSQIAIADNTLAKVYIIPGNHDWNSSKKGGMEAIIRQQQYVDAYKNDSVKFFPKGGCPGPEEISIGNDITLILFDSQWWLQKFEKPGAGSECTCKSKEELVKKIGEIANRNKDKLIVIASHHPFRSKGPHGGYYTLKHHIFPLTDIKKWAFLPLPVIGSIYPLVRAGIGTSQDLKNKNYRAMVKGIEEAIGDQPNVIFAAGHEHGLQLLKDKSFNYIVSGGSAKNTRVNKKKTEFGSGSTGFAVLEISTNKNVRLKFYTVKQTIEIAYDKTTLLNYSGVVK